jgi:hypothetical protein
MANNIWNNDMVQAELNMITDIVKEKIFKVFRD